MGVKIDNGERSGRVMGVAWTRMFEIDVPVCAAGKCCGPFTVIARRPLIRPAESDRRVIYKLCANASRDHFVVWFSENWGCRFRFFFTSDGHYWASVVSLWYLQFSV